MIEKVLILSASIYDFTNSAGENVQGITVFVLHLNAVESGGTLGIKPSKYNLPLSEKMTFLNTALPAYADLELVIDFNRMKPIPKSFTNLTSAELGAELVG